MQEELAVAFRPAQRRGRHVEDVPATQHRVTRQALDHGAMLYGIAHDTALADVLAAGLELRLDERDHFAARGEHVENRRQHLLQRYEGHVDHGQRGLVAEQPRVERARFRVLHHDDTRILAQLVVELAAADIHRVDDAGAALQQAVGEAAGRRADVHTDAALEVRAEVLERMRELLTATADVGRPALELHLRLSGHQGAGFVGALPVHQDVAGHDRAQRLLAAVQHSLLHQEAIQPHPGRHAVDYRRALLGRYDGTLLRGRRRNRSTAPARNPPM